VRAGIGRAIAVQLSNDGYAVAVGDVDIALAKSVAAELGTPSVGLYLDVVDRPAFESFVNEVERTLGPVSVLVNNAGIMPIGPFTDLDDTTLDAALDVNVRGPINGIRVVLPRLLDQGGGHIVNIASLAGKMPPPGGAVYAATKHAVVGLGDSLRQEYVDQNISVTTVLPTFTNTELVEGTQGLRGIRTVEPQDVARAVSKALRTKRENVYVPGYLRLAVLSHATLPPAVLRFLTRVTKADRAFVDIDHAKRQRYDARIRRSA
jgi:NADP-dependent 3-hydroxy acid dehydrogenase YdfG